MRTMPTVPSPPSPNSTRPRTANISRPGLSSNVAATSTATPAAQLRNGTPTQNNSTISSVRARGTSDKENNRRPSSRRSSVLAGRDRPPARDGTVQRHAKEVEGLKDYQLGHCLGRGAFGSVYSALNWQTGETVAIKQVRLSDMPKTELNVIMQEIDLLKNLHHPNIVKYHGFVKNSEALWIILEYCEQGSLYNICKNFGKFPENLVGLYTAQVLQGLLFLHDQGVIHRDIKGANILTTKEGLVKLADFGVATKQQGLAEGSVVGTPYWMAPEVIELAGATTASDIWSLGCTVIELLDGKPPYHKFAPMPALFRIVNDDHPPLPEGASPLVRDFLMQCFQKDPNLRVTAKKLLRHPWIVSAKKADTSTKGEKKMEYDEAVQSVKQWNEALKASPPQTQGQRTSGNTGSKRLPNRPGSRSSAAPAAERPSSRNSARPAKSPAKPPFRLSSKRSSSALAARGQSVSRGKELLDTHETSNYVQDDEKNERDNWDRDFVSLTTDMASLQLPTHRKPQDHFQGLFSSERLKQYANFDAIPEMDSEGKMEAWDEDFEGGEGELTVRSPMQLESTSLAQHERRVSRDSQPKTQILKPLASKRPNERSGATVATSQPPPPPPQKARTNPTQAPLKQQSLQLASSSGEERWAEDLADEDYSDLVPNDHDEVAFHQKLVGFSPDRPLHRDEMTYMQNGMVGSIQRSRRRTQTPTHLVHDAAAMRRTRSSMEIQKYAESEDEDFGQDLIFDEARRGIEFAHVVQSRSRDSPSTKSLAEGSESGESRLSSSDDAPSAQSRQVSGGSTLKLSNSLSWGDDRDEDEDEEDPFAQLEEELDDVDLELNVARDKHARLCTLVEGLVGEIKLGMLEDDLLILLDQLLGILDDAAQASGATAGPDIRNVIVSSHGILPILEILDETKRPDVILRLLRVVNRILTGSPEVQENLCFVGGIPVITRFASRKFSTEILLEAAAFVRMMYSTGPVHASGTGLATPGRTAAIMFGAGGAPSMTLQMFVACGGLNVLVEFLEEDYDTPTGRELVLTGVNGIWSVFELQGSTPKNDFCRIFSRSAILYPLSLILNRVLDEDGELARVVESRIVNIFLLFSQAESFVKESVADRMVLKRVLKDLGRLQAHCQIVMLKFIKNLSMLATTLDALQNSNAIEVLTDFLGEAMERQQEAQTQQSLSPQTTTVAMSKRVAKTPLAFASADLLPFSSATASAAASASTTTFFREITNQLLNTMYNLCRLSSSRQEDAALSGLIPLLQRIVQTERPLKEFALPILCDMAHSGKVGRKILWQNKGLQFYIDLLKEPYWAVAGLESVFVWLQEETGKVEEFLLSSADISAGVGHTVGIPVGRSNYGGFPEAIVNCFVEAKADVFENLLEPLQKLLRLSPAIAACLSTSRAFFERAVTKLFVAKKALVRLNLLRVLRSIVDAATTCGHRGTPLSQQQHYQHHHQQHSQHALSVGDGVVGMLVRETGLLQVAQRLWKEDSAILVREMAGELVRSCEVQQVDAAALAAAAAGGMENGKISTAPRKQSSAASTPLSAVGTGRGAAGYFDFQPLGSTSARRRESATPSLGAAAAATATGALGGSSAAIFGVEPRMANVSAIARRESISRSSSRASDISNESRGLAGSTVLPSGQTQRVSGMVNHSHSSSVVSQQQQLPYQLRPNSRASLLLNTNKDAGSVRPPSCSSTARFATGRLSLASNASPALSSHHNEPALTPTHHAPPSANTRAAVAQAQAQQGGRRRRVGGSSVSGGGAT